ncbi:MAG: YdcF family protein [Opitutaceae bacterium]
MKDMPISPAESVYQFLSARNPNPLQPADLIIGFGHFDLRVAYHCAEIWRAGLAPLMLFTGGVGAGSADLNMPEAEAFAQALFERIPDFPRDQLIIESLSTNTGDNIRFSLELMKQAEWQVDSAILVATPFRQRRVMQTWAKEADDISTQNAPPESDLLTDQAVFAEKREDLTTQLTGEIERLISYPECGWIAPTEIPLEITRAVARI